jgi:hypothetical protein
VAQELAAPSPESNVPAISITPPLVARHSMAR